MSQPILMRQRCQNCGRSITPGTPFGVYADGDGLLLYVHLTRVEDRLVESCPLLMSSSTDRADVGDERK